MRSEPVKVNVEKKLNTQGKYAELLPTVVAQDPEGLGKRPLWGGVGGETAVVDGKACRVVGVHQVLVELSDNH